MAGGFHSLGLMPEILKAVDELGWNLPTDVQDESIPLILGMLLLYICFYMYEWSIDYSFILSIYVSRWR